MHHKIKAALYKNQFAKSEAKNYIARVKPDLTLSPQEICRIAIERGGHSATAEALAYHADAFLRELTYQLLDNVAVHTDDFQFSLSIRGTFDSNQDNFDPERHALIVEIQPTKRMQKKLAALEIELANSKDSYTTIDTVTDTKTG
ncbi:MAG: hypothetical protein LBJ72_03990, partial [Dysgonamonadaceae bacterium]|nr:hypothetical protein [Dysgonamonadaceae bacterium]